jgi:hypothetical protein
MYVQQIIIQGIRCFRAGPEGVNLDFERPDGSFAGWTVVAGRNGSGKSSFLQALAIALSGPETARTLKLGWASWLRQDEEEGRIAARLVRHDDDGFVGGGRTPKQRSIWTCLRWATSEEGPEPLMQPQPFRDSSIRTADRGPWAENPVGWLVAGYGPFRRASSATGDATRMMMAPGHVARLVSLFREDATLAEGVSWLDFIYVRKLEQKQEWVQLEADVLRLLNDGLLPSGFVAERIDSDGLWVRQGNTSLPLRELSDGYRTVAALILDIVRHVFMANGSLGIEEVDGHVVVPHSGVVLIDEIDAHLHVSWQKEIGFWLKQRFPAMQFIVSTHSPFICQAADPGGLIRLPGPGEDGVAEHVSDELFLQITKGGAEEATVSELFGLDYTHSDESEDLRREVARREANLLGKKDAPASVLSELNDLRQQLPATGMTAVDEAWRLFTIEKSENSS